MSGARPLSACVAAALLLSGCGDSESEAQSQPPSQAEEMAATLINAAGYLCADITNAYDAGGTFVVECVEYRSGAGHAKYSIDLKTGAVRRL